MYIYLYRNCSVIQYKLGLYVFETSIWGFCHFLIQSSNNNISPPRPFTSDFGDFMSIICNTTKFWIIKNLIPAMFVLVKRFMKRTASKIAFLAVLSLILSKTPSPFS